MKFVVFYMLAICMLLASACTPKPPAVFPNGSFTTQEITGSGTADITMELDNGHFKVTSSDVGPLAEGTYKQDGDRVTFTEEAAELIAKSICGPQQTVYTYQWSVDPQTNNLQLKKVDDSCSPRAGVTSTTWKVAQSSPE
jgi:hypothetical protein